MKTVRKAEERGHVQWDWLDSYHSFSFGEYYDPDHVSWGPLRVLNDDTIAGGGGFPRHPHRDMEIFSYVTEGALAHEDSTGAESQVHPGRVQLMGAGTGIYHSEFNPSQTDSTRLLQVWIQPSEPGLPPSYQEEDFHCADRENQWLTLASPTGENGLVDIRQDARILNAVVRAGHSLELPSSADRKGWLQVAEGKLTVDGIELKRGDGLALESENSLELKAITTAELLYFDLPG